MNLKQLLKRTALYTWIADRRAAEAEKYLRFANLYPEKVEAILADFRFSIQRDHRGILQVLNLEESIDYMAVRRLPGAIVETGVFTGGASAYALRSLKRHGIIDRAYWGFDSFEGMPKPTAHDGQHAKDWLGTDDASGKLTGCDVNHSDYAATQNYLFSTGYPTEHIHLVKGWFQDTLPVTRAQIGPIAILRLDGDFYESTKVALECLFDSVVSGGVVIVDDYGSFEGCRKAVDEFLRARNISPFVHYVENGVRFFVKP